MFIDDTKMQKERGINISCIQNCEYIMLRAFINSIFIKCHAKCKDFCTSVQANNLILCDCGKILIHNVTKHLEMLTLVAIVKIIKFISSLAHIESYHFSRFQALLFS
jgi:hypothetical protein